MAQVSIFKLTHPFICLSYLSKMLFRNWNYFGNGESFLWRMRRSRSTACSSICDQAVLESELDVYPATGINDYFQLCLHNKMIVGGGENTLDRSDFSDGQELSERMTDAGGFGICIDEDLLTGTSSPCSTFNNPCLFSRQQNTSNERFEIANLEVWTLTPFSNVEEAEKLELSLLFLKNNLN